MTENNVFVCWDPILNGAEIIDKTINAVKREGVRISTILFLICQHNFEDEKFKDNTGRNTKERLTALKVKYEKEQSIRFVDLNIPNKNIPWGKADDITIIEKAIEECVFRKLLELKPTSIHISLTSGTKEMIFAWISLTATSKLERIFGGNIKLWHFSDDRAKKEDKNIKVYELVVPKNPYIEAIELAIHNNKIIKPVDLDLNKEIEKNCLVNKPMLLLGERGIGKSTIVETTIYEAKRNIGLIKETGKDKKNIQTVICGQLDNDLVNDELFGHIQGAFTNARKERKGAIELADGGILFLDEIHDLPHNTQRKLLRVLQNHKFYKIGDTENEINSDFQLVCASNLPLRELQKRLFPDFFDRISTFITKLTPLRELPVDKIKELWINRWADCWNNKYIIPEKPDKFELVKDTLIRSKMFGNIRDIEQLIAYIARDVYGGNINKSDYAKEEAYKKMLARWEADYNEKHSYEESYNTISKEQLEQEGWSGINKQFKKWLAGQAEDVFGSQINASKAMKCQPKTLRNAKEY